MIIWINGAFGSGKTHTAAELHRRLKDSYIYDPEEIGYFIRGHVPEEAKEGDFQDYALWRKFNYEMLRYNVSKYDGIIIVPMTLTSATYYDEIIGKLRGEGIPLHHYILDADRETLLKRLRSRLEGEKSWAAQQIDRCLLAFSKEITETKIMTDGKSIDEVVDEIAKQSGLTLEVDQRSRLRKKIDRFKVTFKHIRG